MGQARLAHPNVNPKSILSAQWPILAMYPAEERTCGPGATAADPSVRWGQGPILLRSMQTSSGRQGSFPFFKNRLMMKGELLECTRCPMPIFSFYLFTGASSRAPERAEQH